MQTKETQTTRKCYILPKVKIAMKDNCQEDKLKLSIGRHAKRPQRFKKKTPQKWFMRQKKQKSHLKKLQLHQIQGHKMKFPSHINKPNIK